MSDDESSPPPGKEGGGRKKRANHNELERKRRHHQKNTMNDLRDAVPILQMEKPSTVSILSKAKEYIQMLEQRAYEQEEELGGLRKRLKLPPLSGKLMAPPVSGNADLTRKKVESVRRENDELRNKIMDVERAIASVHKGGARPAVSAVPAFGSVDPNLVLAAHQAAVAEEEDDVDDDEEEIIDDI